MHLQGGDTTKTVVLVVVVQIAAGIHVPRVVAIVLRCRPHVGTICGAIRPPLHAVQHVTALQSCLPAFTPNQT